MMMTEASGTRLQRINPQNRQHTPGTKSSNSVYISSISGSAGASSTEWIGTPTVTIHHCFQYTNACFVGSFFTLHAHNSPPHPLIYALNTHDTVCYTIATILLEKICLKSYIRHFQDKNRGSTAFVFLSLLLCQSIHRPKRMCKRYSTKVV